jgi:hypothetical protein
MTPLHYDPALIIDPLDALPVVTSRYGTTPSCKKADLILAIAPAYIEIGRYLTAFARNNGFDQVFTYGDPFPWPIIEPSPEYLGYTPEFPGTFILDLNTGMLVDSVPETPSLAFKVSSSGSIIDLLISYHERK